MFALKPTYIPQPGALGTYAEYVTAKNEWVAAVPDNLPLEQAGGVPLVALTAWQALHSASAKSGQRILILAASGSVGHLAVQLAKNLGLYVVGTASAKNLDLVRNFGADEAVDYAGGAADLRARYGGSDETKFDIVLDLVGGETLEVAAAELLRAGGAIAHVQNAGTDHAANAKHAAAAAAGGPRWATILVQPSGAQLEELARLIGEGKLRLHIAKSFPLSEVRRHRNSLPLPPRDAPAAARVHPASARRLPAGSVGPLLSATHTHRQACGGCLQCFGKHRRRCRYGDAPARAGGRREGGWGGVTGRSAGGRWRRRRS